MQGTDWEVNLPKVTKQYFVPFAMTYSLSCHNYCPIKYFPSGSQSVVPALVSLASLRNLLEIQIRGPHPTTE